MDETLTVYEFYSVSEGIRPPVPGQSSSCSWFNWPHRVSYLLLSDSGQQFRALRSQASLHQTGTINVAGIRGDHEFLIT